MRAEALSVRASPPALRALGAGLAAMLMVAVLLPLLPRLEGSSAPLTLEVAGVFKHVTPEAVRHAAAPGLQNSFYALDLDGVKVAVETLPWVARARVERLWPARVRVQVWEHRPYARWDREALLSEDGVVFIPEASALPTDLPQLAGPGGQQHRVRDVYEALREHLSGTPFVPVQLQLDTRGEWTAVTADGITLRLGREAPLEAAARLTGPVPMALAERLQEVAYVDLHYINGFAVGWRDTRAPDARGAGVHAEKRHD
ncbi:MAG: cell division protein FtsQ/DivIB [Nevskiales bacterium]|nr:cell division protein FtsQ/DivIB [Nevskiales bacterium]